MSRVPPSARMETHSLSHSVASDSNESLSLKLQLQESLLKLEERNLLLGKAKSAMELLSNEVSRLRLENKEKTIHNEKMVRIIKDNEENLSKLSIEIKERDNSASLVRMETGHHKEELSALNDKYHLSLSQNEVLTTRLSETRKEMDQVEEKYLMNQTKLCDVEEELTQCRAMVDLYKLQYTEACEEKEKLKLSIDHERSRITELTNQYETQFNAIRSAHELEKENIRLSHIKSLDDIRKKYANDIEVVKEKEKQEVTSIITQRNYERTDEIKLLKALMDKDKLTIEKYESELTHLKAELLAKTESLENVRITDATKTEEINNLRPYKDSVVSLQQAVQKESLERTQLQIHYDVHVKEIERLVALVKEKENHIALVDTDSSSLRSELSELRKQNDVCEEYVTLNEKLRTTINDLKAELVESKHRNAEFNHDLRHANETIHNLNTTISELTDTIDELNKKVVNATTASSNIKGINDQLNEQLYAYRDQIKGLEASITDHNKLINSLQGEVSDHKAVEAQYQRVVDDLMKLSTLNFDQMCTWDAQLDTILDGMVTSVNNNSFNNSLSNSSSSGVALFAYDLNTSVNVGSGDQIGSIKQQAGHLNQRLAVQMDRINHNFTRIIKIKSHFHTMVSRFTKDLQGKMDLMHSKNEYNQEKLRNAMTRIDSMKKTIDRDRKQKDSDHVDLLNFRQSMLENINSYTAKCVEYETKVTTLTVQLEKEREMSHLSRGVLEREYTNEKHKIEELLQQKDREKDELLMQLNSCNAHVTMLKENMKNISSIENQMMELTVKLTALTVNNENLVKEMQQKESELQRKDHELQQIQQVHTNTVTELEVLQQSSQRELQMIQQTSQREIDVIQRKLEELKLLTSQQEEKIVELSQRQVDPSLVALFKESQSLLQGFNETIQRGSSVVGSPGSVTSVDANNESNAMSATAQGSRYSSRPSFSPGPVNVLPMNKSELVVSSPDASDKYYNYSENAPRNFLMSPPTSFYNTALSSSGLSASSLASYSLGASSKYLISARKNEEIIESGYAHTPNHLQLSSEKLRITRIGNDLNLLAQKLDAFEKGSK